MQFFGGLVAGCVWSLLATSAYADNWKPHNVRDHLRGSVGVGTAAIGEIEERSGTHEAELIVNCAENSTTVVVTSRFVFFGTNKLTVEYTINGGAVQRAVWSTCAETNCAGLWAGAGIPFLKSLQEKALLRMTFTRYTGTKIHADFDITGAKEAFVPVGRACGWIAKP